jgi:hypothetical protein
VTVKVPVAVAPPPVVAVTTTEVLEPTALVVAVNVAVVAPASTVTFAGTEAAALLLDSEIVVPPTGAALLNVTVPVEFATPPLTVAGLNVTEARIGTTVSVSDG